MKTKKLQWVEPVLVELGSAKRMSTGNDIPEIVCNPGSGVKPED